MSLRTTMVTEARKFLGVRFEHQGRDPGHGLDCLGLLLIVAERAGLEFDGLTPMALDRRDYRLRPDAAQLELQLRRLLNPIEPSRAALGDVVLLSIDGSPQHLALLSDYPLPGELGMIHAYAVARKVVEHRYDAHWRKATHAAFELPVVN